MPVAMTRMQLATIGIPNGTALNLTLAPMLVKPMVHSAALFVLFVPLAQIGAGSGIGAESQLLTAPRVIADPEPPPLTPESPEFDRRMHDCALKIEVRSTDGVLVREASAVITGNSGYVMTSLDAVVGGAVYTVTGGTMKAARSATPLAVTRMGDLAILQLQLSKDDRFVYPPRAKSPPVVGDRVYAVVTGAPGRKEGKVISMSEPKDGSRLLRTNLSLDAGTGLYNSRGELAAIVRKSGKASTSTLAVFAPARMLGNWVEYFPARVGAPVHKIAPEDVKPPNVTPQ